MDAKQFLNALLYPSASDNIRRKDWVLHRTLAIAAGQNEYIFGNAPAASPFLGNYVFPLSGQQIFVINGISLYLPFRHLTVAQLVDLCDLLQSSYLEITVNQRLICKLPGLDFLQYILTVNEDATPEILGESFADYNLADIKTNGLIKRRLPYPILINSTQDVVVKWVISTASATAYDTVPVTLNLHGIMTDKLNSFTWDDLNSNLFQKIPVTLYDTFAIPDGTERTFNLFQTNSPVGLNSSFRLPVSDIQAFEIQNIEVLFSPPEDPANSASLIYTNRLNNLLIVNIDDVEYYRSNLLEKLSVIAGRAVNLTTAAADTLASVTLQSLRGTQTLKLPLNFPAQANIQIALRQPANSVLNTFGTVALRGVGTRRVA